MKTVFTFLFLAISSICFSQNSIENESVKTNDENSKIAPAEISIETRFVTEDEGSNDPTTTGAKKVIVNGEEVYIKESESNGIRMISVQEPNN